MKLGWVISQVYSAVISPTFSTFTHKQGAILTAVAVAVEITVGVASVYFLVSLSLHLTLLFP